MFAPFELFLHDFQNGLIRFVLEGGGGSAIQGFVYQQWPKNLFPLQNLIFPRRNVLTDPGGGGSSLPLSESSTRLEGAVIAPHTSEETTFSCNIHPL